MVVHVIVKEVLTSDFIHMVESHIGHLRIFAMHLSNSSIA